MVLTIVRHEESIYWPASIVCGFSYMGQRFNLTRFDGTMSYNMGEEFFIRFSLNTRSVSYRTCLDGRFYMVDL